MQNEVGSKPVMLGVVGLGRAFMLMLPTFLNDDRVQLAAAAARNKQQLRTFAEQFHGSTVGDIDALCADPRVEAVYIATPHEMHCDQVIKILAANKHVLVEKPMTINVTEARTIVRAVENSNFDVIVGPSHSYDLPVSETARILASGKYGPVRMINARYYTDFVYRPRRPEELDTSLGGGAIFNQGAHHADILMALTGARATSVSAFVGDFDPERSCDGAYSALIEFENNCFASITYSGYAHYDGDEEMAWISEMGMPKDPENYGMARRKLINVDQNAESLEKSKKGYHEGYTLPTAQQNEHFGNIIISCQKADLRPTPQGIHIYSDDGYEFIALSMPDVPRASVIDELYQLVRQGIPPVHSASRALNTIALCEGIYNSARQKQRVEVTN